MFAEISQEVDGHLEIRNSHGREKARKPFEAPVFLRVGASLVSPMRDAVDTVLARLPE
jgi:hypothetical protein